MAQEGEATSVSLLKIGDFVTLFHEDYEGYIYGENPVFPSLHVKPHNSKLHPELSNVKGAVFEVIIPGKYKIANRLRKLRSKFEKAKLNPEDEEEINSLEKLAKLEAQDNDIEMQRQRGKFVRYGQPIQLRHSLTLRNVRISSTEAAKLDVLNMSVDLHPENSKHCWFRIMPRFKVRAEGDLVRMDDQVLIESIKMPSRYLNCSGMKFSEGIDVGCHEVDLSIRSTPFVICPYYVPLESEVRFLKGGDVICLLHKELDSYLIAEGIFTEKDLIEDIHLRQRPQKATLEPDLSSTNANSFFQVEVDQEECKGDSISWESNVRLKHMITRTYLGVKSGKPFLTQQTKSTHTVFRFAPLVKSGLFIEKNSYAKIEHPKSDAYLHAAEEKYEYNQYKVPAAASNSMASLKWDKAKLNKLSLLPQVNFDDAFALVPIKDDVLQNFNFIMGVVPVLHAFVSRYQGKKIQKLTSEEYQYIASALKTLKSFLNEGGEIQKMKQDLLRYTRVVEMLILVLQVPFKSPKGFESVKGFNPNGIDMEELVNFPRFKQTCWTTNDILADYLNGGTKKNALYLARYIDFFQTQVGYDINTAGMLRNLLRDNTPVVDRVQEDNIDYFITWLRKQKNPDFLDFLGVLCVCEGRAMSKNQTMILKMLLSASKQDGILLQTKIEGEGLVVKDRGTSQWQPIAQFLSQPLNQKFLEYQLTLFSRLCFGRNEDNIVIISENFVSLDQALFGMRDATLPPLIRAAFCDILQNVFIDVERNQPVLRRIQMSYVWNELEESEGEKAAKDEVLSMCGERMPFFPRLKEWIVKFIDEQKVLICSKEKPEIFKLISSVLKMVQSLALFGYYTNINDITTLLKPLYELLDGSIDRPQEKIEADDLKAWRSSGRYLNIPANRPMFRVKKEALAVLDVLFNYQFSSFLNDFMLDFKSLLAMKGHERKNAPFPSPLQSTLAPEVLALLPYVEAESVIPPAAVHNYFRHLRQATNFIDPENRLVNICMDLARSQDNALTIISLQIVNRHFMQIADLFDKGTIARVLLVEESVNNFKRVMQILPVLRRLTNIKLEDEHIEEMTKIVDELIKLCSLTDDTTEPHPANQRIMTNARVIADIFEIFRKPVDMSLRDQYSGLINIRKKCFTFLNLFCRKSPVIKRRLFDQFDELLAVQGAEKELGLLIAEMFKDNEELAMIIREDHIKTMVELLAKHQIHEIWIAINAVVRIEYFPIKRNQNFAIKYLMQNRSSTILLIDKADRDRRIELMRKATVAKNGGSIDPSEMTKAMYHQFQMRTLATCAEGENKFIESMCQNMMSLDDLFEVLSDPNIHMDFKRPYLRFLLWAYLSTASGSFESGVSDIGTDPRSWALVQDVMDRVVEVSNKDLSTLMIKFPMDTVYMFEAAVPFFSIFYERYYSPDASLTAVIPNHKQITQKAFDVLLDFYRKMKQCPTYASGKERKRINFALQIFIVNQFITDQQLQQYEEVGAIKIKRGEQKDKTQDGAGSDKPSVLRYLQEYKQQLDTNNVKNDFVGRLKKAYEEDPAYPQYDEEMGIPRGDEFQQHLHILIKYKKNSFKLNKKNIRTLVRGLKISLDTYSSLGEFEKATQVELDRKTLALLLACIETEQLRTDEDKFPSSAVRRAEKNVYKIRSLLNQEGVTVRAVKNLAHKEESTVNACLQLLISLLEGGHPECQHSLYEYFKSTAEEQFFIVVRTHLQNSMVVVKEARVLASMKSARVAKEKELASTSKATRSHKKSASMNHSVNASVGGGETELTTLVLPLGAEEDDADDGGVDVLTFAQVVGIVKPIFRMLQLLCENHNKKLREYLREQPDNLKSFNVIKEVATYLGVVYTNVDAESIEIVIQVLESLNEFAMGNVENQLVLFDSKAMDVVNQLMRQPQSDFGGCDPSAVAEMKLKAITLVKTMLEDNSLVAQNLAKQILSMLDLEAVYENMLIYHGEEAINEDYVFSDVGYICANVLARLKDLLDQDTTMTDRERKALERKLELYLFSQDEEQLHDLYLKYERKGYDNVFDVSHNLSKGFEAIEILVEGELQKIYFRSTTRKTLSQRMRDDLLFQVNRDSPTERIRDFVDRGFVIQDKLKFLKIMDRNVVSRIIIKNQYLIYVLILLLTLTINVFMISTWKASGDFGSPTPIVESWYYTVLYALGGTHIFLSLLVVIGHFLTDPPLQFGKRDEEEGGNVREKDEDEEELRKAEAADLANMELGKKKKKKKEKKRKIINKKSKTAEAREWFEGVWAYVHFSDLYHLLFLAMSILGLVTDGYTYCFHLLHVVVNNDILLRVLQSVTKNGISLLWVAALGVIIIYIYSVVAFAFYRGSFSYGDQLWCDTMWQCFVTSLNFGLRSGGGIGDVLLADNVIWYNVAIKIFFDLSFFIIVTVIGLNIIFGIIVDTFSELRDERYRIVDDMQSVCFICGLPSYDFERKASGFEHHIKKEHNMWGYLLFSIYLSEKNPSEYTAFEAYVADQIRRNEISWFPINRALALSREDTTIEDELQRIWKTLDALVKRFKEEDLRKQEEAQKSSYQRWKEEARQDAE